MHCIRLRGHRRLFLLKTLFNSQKRRLYPLRCSDFLQGLGFRFSFPWFSVSALCSRRLREYLPAAHPAVGFWLRFVYDLFFWFLIIRKGWTVPSMQHVRLRGYRCLFLLKTVFHSQKRHLCPLRRSIFLQGLGFRCSLF